ncbi:MAG: DUF3800 domain-containing protein [Lentisphaeria bacterium]|nr:DUF3800 domain-containing protein [Lentisphaeria bacterium]
MEGALDSPMPSQRHMHAFVDEFGQFGFDFAKPDVSERFIVAAVLCPAEGLDELRAVAVRLQKSKWFQNREMKSKILASDGQKWLEVCLRLTQLPVSLWVLVVDKRRLYGAGVTGSKQQFYKYLYGLLYDHLYRQYPSLSIVADMQGHEEFMQGFRKYVEGKQDLPLFAHAEGCLQEFTFRDSMDDVLVQLADLFAGAFARCHEPGKQLDQVAQMEGLLTSMKPRVEFFPREARNLFYTGENASEEEKHNAIVADHCFKAAESFLDENAGTDDESMAHRLFFLRILRDHFVYDSDDSYVQTHHIATWLNETFYREPEFDTKYVTRAIVPYLRSRGRLIIASTTKGGYKIPTKLADVYDYLNHCNQILEPMLGRMFKCHETILSVTQDVELLRKDCYHIAWFCFQDYLLNRSKYTSLAERLDDGALTEDDF